MYGLLGALLLWGGACWAVRKDIARAWAEPCLKHPVLVFEGDDWGYGTLDQAQALDDIARVLAGHRDRAGRHPVMTLGIILAGPDAARPDDPAAATGLDHPELAPVLTAIRAGAARGVFALQLHGMQHYHPQVLDHACSRDSALQAWRRQPLPATEDLPSPLQSRWTDGSVLPSRDLPLQDIAARVAEEVAAFVRCFGEAPRVAVPPTFVWNDAVERAWVEGGVAVLVTPGERYERRGADGLPQDTGLLYRNGQRCGSGLLAMVRDDYYEPVRGHRADRGLAALAVKTAQRRPLLLETHRSNFVGRHARHADSLQAIDTLLSAALRQAPDLCFMSVEALAAHYADPASPLFDRSPGVRLRALAARVLDSGRRRKVAALVAGAGVLLAIAGGLV